MGICYIVILTGLVVKYYFALGLGLQIADRPWKRGLCAVARSLTNFQIVVCVMAMKQDQIEKRNRMEFLTRVASLYYLEGKTQAAVARQMNISRQKAQRLLGQCREQGIVEINIRTLDMLDLDLEKDLRDKFGLQEVIMATPNPDETERRLSVARAAASFLERRLKSGITVAVGMGRNTGALPIYFNSSRRIACNFASAMGSSPHVGQSINPNDIAARLAASCGGESMAMLAPAYVESPQVRDILMAQEAVGPALKQAKGADVALLGIGAPAPDATLVRMECLSKEESLRLQKKGAVGDILGAHFDQQGQMVASEMHGRLVGLNFEDLRRIETVVALVSEKNKAKAILGALRTGVISVLITDSENGREVMRLAG